MKVKLISAKVRTSHIFHKGVVDRRYKTGYRVMPEDYIGYEISLRLSNPDLYFRIGTTVLALNTRFLIINVDNMSQIMTLRQCRAIERGNEFEINAEIEVLPLGYMVGEGSLNPQ